MLVVIVVVVLVMNGNGLWCWMAVGMFYPVACFPYLNLYSASLILFVQLRLVIPFLCKKIHIIHYYHLFLITSYTS